MQLRKSWRYNQEVLVGTGRITHHNLITGNYKGSYDYTGKWATWRKLCWVSLKRMHPKTSGHVYFVIEMYHIQQERTLNTIVGVALWRLRNDVTISLYCWLWRIHRRRLYGYCWWAWRRRSTTIRHRGRRGAGAGAASAAAAAAPATALTHLSCLLWLRRHNLITGIKLSYKPLLIYKRLFGLDIRHPPFLYLFIGFFALLGVSRVFDTYLYIWSHKV